MRATTAIRRAHDAAVAAGEPGYLDPETGFFVFTAAALAANGDLLRQRLPPLPLSLPTCFGVAHPSDLRGLRRPTRTFVGSGAGELQELGGGEGRGDPALADGLLELGDPSPNGRVGAEAGDDPVVDHRPHPVDLLALAAARPTRTGRLERAAVGLDLRPHLVEVAVLEGAAGEHGG